ncbi:RHS repeat-associated core domain-containing protein [Pseudoalteromonas sp. NEC-BIFX-2020_015]|uniref:RHS repeat-associated core domain-containing protein n=1 Tax=Pseudoalteromonas sp. NEC-BIFX-2020_015 TaxID=2729544 RepID=UPI00146143BB|nr:RHS repeat-associated core domain-containing protein [Pseudoalteromonas sp. NEC-BIFX-2020_015]NMR26315.1 RHS repeat-associated core domain-containing protein [Pseudoalteromonas sp. NEC-BIFX-2020_015]
MHSQDGTLLYREKGDTITGNGTHYIYLGKKLIAKYGDVTPQTVNESRQHSRSFGESIEAPKDDVGYTGHKFDTDLGLSYMQARYYDPVIGRFYSSDPVGTLEHLSGLGGIHGFNRYAYANNNPYKYVDPDGEAVIYAGFTGGGNAGVSGDNAGGVFFDVSFDGIKFGTYTSHEIGSSTGTPSAGAGFEMGAMTGGYETALNGEYMIAGGQGGAGAVGTVAGNTTLGPTPEVGVQLSLEEGTPQANGFIHTGTGQATVVGSLTGQDVSNGLQSAGQAIQSTMGAIATNIQEGLDIDMGM